MSNAISITIHKTSDGKTLLDYDLSSLLNVEDGQSITLVQTPYGFAISSEVDDLNRDLEMIRQIQQKFRPALDALAK
jgi:hypothetical protein